MSYAVKIQRKGIPVILLIALPVFAAVACAHRCLQIYAPSNILARRVRATEPRLRVAFALLTLAAALLVAMHMLAGAVSTGAPGYLNLGVMVLAWDAIKFSMLAGLIAGRCAVGGSIRIWRAITRQPSAPQDSKQTVSA